MATIGSRVKPYLGESDCAGHPFCAVHGLTFPDLLFLRRLLTHRMHAGDLCHCTVVPQESLRAGARCQPASKEQSDSCLSSIRQPYTNFQILWCLLPDCMHKAISVIPRSSLRGACIQEGSVRQLSYKCGVAFLDMEISYCSSASLLISSIIKLQHNWHCLVRRALTGNWRHVCHCLGTGETAISNVIASFLQGTPDLNF